MRRSGYAPTVKTCHCGVTAATWVGLCLQCLVDFYVRTKDREAQPDHADCNARLRAKAGRTESLELEVADLQGQVDGLLDEVQALRREVEQARYDAG